MLTNAEKFSMNDLVYLERTDKNFFKVSWKMLDWCPYNCSYCYMAKAVEAARAANEKPAQAQVEQIATQLNTYINRFVSPDKIVQLHLIGGETAIYDLSSIIDKISHINKISLATNFYRNLEYWQSLKKYCTRRHISLGISASFHLEALQTDEARWAFCEKLLAVGGQMKAVVDESNLEIYRPYFEFVMQNNLGLEITLTRDSENRCAKLSDEHQQYVDSLRAYMQNRRASKGYKPYYVAHLKDGRSLPYSSNISLINNTDDGLANFSGFYCNAGMNNLRVTQKGDFLRSACRICSGIMTIGNALDESSWIDPNTLKPFICNCYTAKLKSKYYNSKKVMKGCTCFNNTEMWKPGYNKDTGVYDDSITVPIPNYHEMYKGTDGSLKNCMWDRADWPNLDESEITNV